MRISFGGASSLWPNNAPAAEGVRSLILVVNSSSLSTLMVFTADANRWPPQLQTFSLRSGHWESSSTLYLCSR